jgi:hypothetical protein
LKKIIVMVSFLFWFNTVFAQWQTIQTPIVENLWGISVVNNSLIFAAGKTSLVKSTNSGLIWTQINYPAGFSSTSVLVSAVDENNIWIASYTLNGRIFHTTNGGLNWIEQNNPYKKYITIIKFFNINTGFIIADAAATPPAKDTLGFTFTRDGGQTWKRPPGCPYISFISDGYPGYKDSNLIWTTAVVDTTAMLFKLTGGFNAQWQTYNTIHNGNTAYTRLAFKDEMNALSIDNNKAYQTTNGGLNWNIKNNEGISNTLVLYNTIIKGSDLVIAHCPTKLRISYNYCNTWEPVISFPASIRLRMLDYIDTTSIFIACDSGRVLKYETDKIGIKPETNLVPEKYMLYQNYPNPFNPVSTIKFDIPANQQRTTNNVQLIIFDILGREVTTLVNEQLKPGTYEVVWPAPSGDVSNYSSGVYYYQLRAGNYIDTKKLVLIK